MSRVAAIRKPTWIELIGILLLGSGLCFAVAGVGVALDEERGKGEKAKIREAVEEMRGKLLTAQIPQDQVAGLLKIHEKALVTGAVHEHFLITSSLVLFSLLVACFGYSLLLHGKVSRLSKVLIELAQTAENRNG